MDPIDIRRVSKGGGQQVLRRQVVAARKAGKTYRHIHEHYGVHPGTACAWWKRYQSEGEAFVANDRRAARKAVAPGPRPHKAAGFSD